MPEGYIRPFFINSQKRAPSLWGLSYMPASFIDDIHVTLVSSVYPHLKIPLFDYGLQF